jgi:hypothetical protein
MVYPDDAMRLGLVSLSAFNMKSISGGILIGLLMICEARATAKLWEANGLNSTVPGVTT